MSKQSPTTPTLARPLITVVMPQKVLVLVVVVDIHQETFDITSKLRVGMSNDDDVGACEKDQHEIRRLSRPVRHNHPL